ncbi:hypothetical protein BLNAU_7749 [Blattamonas nauphoetae]|uniref:Uncharacterized protein n=1 Tax=Blattamonas nauphoetae TaxID=2049346 RepID=A0ABQ9Y0V8_9EUKA|nr:hypothetical protein BLNAU_7749 [Blattamonas nauphoetae]
MGTDDSASWCGETMFTGSYNLFSQADQSDFAIAAALRKTQCPKIPLLLVGIVSRSAFSICGDLILLSHVITCENIVDHVTVNTKSVPTPILFEIVSSYKSLRQKRVHFCPFFFGLQSLPIMCTKVIKCQTSNKHTYDEKPASPTKISLRHSKQFKIEKELDDSISQYTLHQSFAMDRAELESTINDILNAMNTETSGTINRYLRMLSSMTHLAGFCSKFVELNGIATLDSLKSPFYGSDASGPLLTSLISDGLVALLQASEIETTELILKTFINFGVDDIDLFRSQLGSTLLQSVCLLLQKALPLHHEHLFIRDGIALLGESPQDMSTTLCLKILILIVEESEQFRLGDEFVGLVVPLLRHESTDIVLLALATLHTMTLDCDFVETIKTTILVAQVDGETQPIPMIQLVAELFGDYLSRLRAQIGQIQWLWTNEAESAMLIDPDPDPDTDTGGNDYNPSSKSTKTHQVPLFSFSRLISTSLE